MLRRAAICIAASLITDGIHARAAEAAILGCEQQLIATQALVQGKVEAGALTEDEQEAIYEFLDEADGLCADGKSDEASEALATVDKMIANEK